MFARAFLEAQKFRGTPPLGSWTAWLLACCDEVERRHSFKCNWPLLVGMTAAMIVTSRDHQRYERELNRILQRAEERRFVELFAVHALLLANHRSFTCLRAQHISTKAWTPHSVLDWVTMCARVPRILHTIKSQETCLPSTVHHTTFNSDFVASVLFGYLHVIASFTAAANNCGGNDSDDGDGDKYYERQVRDALHTHLVMYKRSHASATLTNIAEQLRSL